MDPSLAQQWQQWNVQATVAPGPRVVLPPPERMAAMNEAVVRQQGLQAKREEESMKRDQHRAALKVRKIIQNVRQAKPDTIDDLRAELETTMAEQIMYMGPLAQKVQEEAETVLIEAQKKIQEETERLMEEQRRQFEEEMNRREEEARVESLAEEVQQEVIEVESKVSQAEELVQPFAEGDAATDESPEGVLEATNVAEEAINSARAELNHVTTGIREKWTSRSDSVASIMQEKLAPQFRQLHSRLAICRRNLDKLQRLTADTKGRVERAAMARKKDREQQELWAKYSNFAGKMTRKEVSAFAEAEYEMELADEQVESIFSRHSHGEGCLPFEKFGQVRSLVANMKNEQAARLRREEEAREKKEFEERKISLRAFVKEHSNLLQAAESTAEEARTMTRPLQAKGSAALSSARLVEVAGEVDEQLESARRQLSDVLEKLSEAELETSSEDSFGRYRKQELDRLRAYSNRIEAQIEKTSTTAENGREQARRKEFTEVGDFRNNAVTAMRKKMTAEGETVEQVFTRACDSSSDMGLGAFTSLLRSLPDLEIEVGQAEALFEHITNGSSAITSDRFSEFARVFYKVSKGTMLTSTVTLGSKVSRKLEQGEIVELINGPQPDDKVGILRVHCRSIAKGDEGWVTIVGNQGTVFLEICGMFFVCAKAVAMTNSLAVKQSMTIRELPKGELLEALGVPTLDESSGTMRIECKAKSDSMSGFVTILAKGNNYLEPC